MLPAYPPPHYTEHPNTDGIYISGVRRSFFPYYPLKNSSTNIFKVFCHIAKCDCAAACPRCFCISFKESSRFIFTHCSSLRPAVVRMSFAVEAPFAASLLAWSRLIPLGYRFHHRKACGVSKLLRHDIAAVRLRAADTFFIPYFHTHYAHKSATMLPARWRRSIKTRCKD